MYVDAYFIGHKHHNIKCNICCIFICEIFNNYMLPPFGVLTPLCPLGTVALVYMPCTDGSQTGLLYEVILTPYPTLLCLLRFFKDITDSIYEPLQNDVLLSLPPLKIFHLVSVLVQLFPASLLDFETFELLQLRTLCTPSLACGRVPISRPLH